MRPGILDRFQEILRNFKRAALHYENQLILAEGHNTQLTPSTQKLALPKTADEWIVFSQALLFSKRNCTMDGLV
jgi:hypothetical protein